VPVERVDIIEDDWLILMRERGAVNAERRRVPIDPGSSVSDGAAHGSAFSSASRADYHEKAQVAGGECFEKRVEFMITFDNDGIARDVFRLGYSPMLLYRAG
jgi:hypothetical protein